MIARKAPHRRSATLPVHRLVAMALMAAMPVAAAQAEVVVPLPFANTGFDRGLDGWVAHAFGAGGGWVEPDAGHAVFSLQDDAAVALLESGGCVDVPALLQSAGLAPGEHEYRVVVHYRLLEGDGQLRTRVRTGFAGDLPEDAAGCIGPETGASASYATLVAGTQFRSHDSGWMQVANGPLAMVDIAFARSSALPLLAEVDGLSVELRTVPVIFASGGFESPEQVAAGASW